MERFSCLIMVCSVSPSVLHYHRLRHQFPATIGDWLFSRSTPFLQSDVELPLWADYSSCWSSGEKASARYLGSVPVPPDKQKQNTPSHSITGGFLLPAMVIFHPGTLTQRESGVFLHHFLAVSLLTSSLISGPHVSAPSPAPPNLRESDSPPVHVNPLSITDLVSNFPLLNDPSLSSELLNLGFV